MYTLHYAPDNASLIVRLVLEELGQPYETVLVDRSSAQQSSAEYKALNPRGLIPVLDTPQGPIFETAAIILWLSETHGALAPQPADAARGDFLKWLFYASNGLHADLRQLFYPEKYVSSVRQIDSHLHHVAGRIAATLDDFEAVATDGHDWFNGTPSVLDFYVGTMLRWMALYPKYFHDWFDLDRWPALKTLAERLEIRPSVQVAIKAEGLGPAPLSAPSYPNPPEGVAL